MDCSQSTDLLADSHSNSLVPLNQDPGNSTAVVNTIDNEELGMGDRKLVFHTPTLGSETDDYHVNVNSTTVLTLETKVRGISYQTRLSVMSQWMNQQLISDINIRH